ncbi:MAG: SIS domain-containing protein [Anaerolineae bacterium]|nr:SIS domain-containing protein [Anaerolineae bacterium]
MHRGSHTWHEITTQPDAWRRTLEGFVQCRPALAQFLKEATFDRILVVGCGSTYYLAQAAAATLAHCAGIPARAAPASELWIFPRTWLVGKTLLVAISRSGTTTETLRALEQFRKRGNGSVLAITCYPESTLAQQADFALTAPDAQEQSIAQTRSFTSMFLLAQALAATLAHDEGMWSRLQHLPLALENLTSRLGDLPNRLGEDPAIEQLFFLGGGPLYGLACEAMLKTKEMSLSQAEAYHPLEFRHGPMSVVNGRTLVVGFFSDTGLAEEMRVLMDMQRLGARTLAFLEEASFSTWQPDYAVELRSGLSEWERGPLYLVPLQYLAYYRALAKGLDPDRPTHLTAVVKL